MAVWSHDHYGHMTQVGGGWGGCSMTAELGCLPSVCSLNLTPSVLVISPIYCFSHPPHFTLYTSPHCFSLLVLSLRLTNRDLGMLKVVRGDSVGSDHPLELFRYTRNVGDADRELPNSCPNDHLTIEKDSEKLPKRMVCHYLVLRR